MEIKYGDFTIESTALPETSIAALLTSGLAHKLGNEIASKVAAWVKGEGQANTKDKATATAWKEANAAAVEAKSIELTNAMFQSIQDGTVGVRTGAGPRVTPLETKRRAIARGEIANTLAGQGVKVPKGEEKVKIKAGEFTMAELVARRLDHAEHGPRITKEAEKAIAAEAKKAQALKDVAKDADL